ncbi:hypothetical protein V8G54_024150 [Vigna mungo]|uniref:Uncharacterized protein n=1 Tax=Vigna mungo TaxID=3915 RepID=A0AAQ3N5F8_VIGMU
MFLEETVGKVRLSQDSEGAFGEGSARGCFVELAFKVSPWPNFIYNFVSPTTFEQVKILGSSLDLRVHSSSNTLVADRPFESNFKSLVNFLFLHETGALEPSLMLKSLLSDSLFLDSTMAGLENATKA